MSAYLLSVAEDEVECGAVSEIRIWGKTRQGQQSWFGGMIKWLLGGFAKGIRKSAVGEKIHS